MTIEQVNVVRMSGAQRAELDAMVRYDLPCTNARIGNGLVRHGWASRLVEDGRPVYRITPLGVSDYLDTFEYDRPGNEQSGAELRRFAQDTMRAADTRERVEILHRQAWHKAVTVLIANDGDFDGAMSWVDRMETSLRIRGNGTIADRTKGAQLGAVWAILDDLSARVDELRNEPRTLTRDPEFATASALYGRPIRELRQLARRARVTDYGQYRKDELVLLLERKLAGEHV